MTNYGFVASKIDGTEVQFKVNNKFELPESINYKKFLPKVVNQGDRPICVPCSVATYINWSLNMEDGVNSRDNKVDYEDILTHSTVERGMSIKDALTYLTHHCAKIKGDCVRVIDRYAKVGSDEQLKQALVINGPCIGGLKVYDSNANKFWINNGNGQFEGGHAVSIVGYNKFGFILRNSWGESYGDKGYSTIPYDEFKYFTEIWTII